MTAADWGKMLRLSNERVKELEREKDHANMVADAGAKKVKELETELIDNLYAQMLRCSEDSALGYEVPGGGDEIAPECGTGCQCPLDCAVYQRWLDLTDADKESASGSESAQ